MGMSASQARLLSLTARMHDLEFQAQGLQYSKLDLVNLKNEAYDEYNDALDSTKYQMSVVTPTGNEYQDITYTNMIMANAGAVHSMYMIANSATGQILLPEQVAKQFKGEMPENLDDFLLKVAKNYLYSGRTDLNSDASFISEMKKDGNYNYWQALYYQIIGYKDDSGNIISGRGFCPISQKNATDREWLADALNSGEVQLFKMSKEESLFTDLKADTHKINIFAETSMATDTELSEVQNTELIAQAESKYEKTLDDIDAKDTKLDLQLSKIDTEHNALKTEYDSVKQIVSKNIDRSFKTFNA